MSHTDLVDRVIASLADKVDVDDETRGVFRNAVTSAVNEYFSKVKPRSSKSKAQASDERPTDGNTVEVEKKKKNKKDRIPTRTGYQFYVQATMTKLGKSTDPSDKQTERMRTVASQWKSVPDTEKQQYTECASRYMAHSKQLQEQFPDWKTTGRRDEIIAQCEQFALANAPFHVSTEVSQATRDASSTMSSVLTPAVVAPAPVVAPTPVVETPAVAVPATGTTKSRGGKRH